MKCLPNKTPLFPCIVVDSGHASVAVRSKNRMNKRFSYTNLSDAFTFEAEQPEISDAVPLVNTESVKIQKLRKQIAN